MDKFAAFLQKYKYIILTVVLAIFFTLIFAACGGDDVSGGDESGNYYWGDVVDEYTGVTLRCLFVDAGSYTIEVPTWCYEP